MFVNIVDKPCTSLCKEESKHTSVQLWPKCHNRFMAGGSASTTYFELLFSKTVAPVTIKSYSYAQL